jgi:hypothetical protein
MKRTSLTLLLTLLALSGCADREISIEGTVCPEGFTNTPGAKSFQECIPYNYEAAKAASQPKASTECVTKECLQTKKDNEDAKSVIQK